MPVKPVPDGFHTVTPHFLVSDAKAFIGFLERAFGAVELHRSEMPDGKIMHAQCRIGDSVVMLADVPPDHAATSTMIYLYVPDADAVFESAVTAGAKPLREPSDQPYGDRAGGVEDAFGNQWWMATHIEDVTPEEIERRMKEGGHG